MNRIAFPKKRSGATVILAFDFLSMLSAQETINAQSVSASVYTGVDPAPGTIVQGPASALGSIVSQSITGGVNGTIYELICTASTSKGQILQLAGYLAVLGEIP